VAPHELPHAHRPPISVHIPVVFFQVPGKAMMPIPVADKIKKVCAIGCIAASSALFPGFAIGPGGNPANRYVLYGDFTARSA